MSEVKVNKISPRTNCGTVTVGDAGDSVTVTAGVPVTVNGDLKSNALKAVDGGSIISQCGTNITLGASGDTINLAAGATQSGFGRTGTVDWDTTAKTASFTAVSGNGYFVNTTSAAVTMTLPASPSAGDIISVADYANTFATNNLTIGRNSQPINGGTNDYISNTNGISLTFVYVDGTRGWKNVNDATTDATGLAPFVEATGGTIVTCGDYKTHIFTSPGTFTVTNTAPVGSGNPNVADYLVVAGGGSTTPSYGAGGGAGGMRVSNNPGSCIPSPTMSPLVNTCGVTLSVTAYPITVGGGGSSPSSNGSNSVFSTITSAGGGYGGANQSGQNGANGGSGGGGRSGGSGNSPPVSPPQGNPGGPSPAGVNAQGGGGGAGGAGGAGGPGSSCSGPAGAGSFIADTFIGPTAPTYGTPGPVGSTRYFAGGGRGGADSGNPYPGGPGGGGPSSPNNATASGQTNTGGGAGGNPPGGANGGSGIVMIRYKYQ
jgi:hypothetical protein